jgi:hypothetical protein
MGEITKYNSSFLSLGMGNNFIQRAEKLGLFKLGDLMDVKVANLKRNKEFNFLWYSEMLDLLKQQGLLRKFQLRQFSNQL